MLIACWSVKGGSGTTVVAAALALLLARAGQRWCWPIWPVMSRPRSGWPSRPDQGSASG